jgi:hypothetical protein
MRPGCILAGVHRLRRVFDGTGGFSGFALGLWLLAAAMLGGILLSPHGWQWWMDVHSVQGHEKDGLVYYSVRGANYSLNDPHSFSGSTPTTRTVYFLASDPGSGSLHNTLNQVIDWGSTVGPAAIGSALLVTGFVQRSRRRRAAAARDLTESFGYGISSETVRSILARNSHNRPQHGH